MSEERVVCFLAEPTGMARVSLRRYCSEVGHCPVNTYHHAKMVVEIESEGERPASTFDLGEYVGDVRWPTDCVCGYVFIDGDQRQVFRETIYGGHHPLRGDIQFTLDEAPAGAIWRAPQFEDFSAWCGDDGCSYFCQTPEGPWHLDGPSADGTRWIRTGEPPVITVTPSILKSSRNGHPDYQADLTAGVLIPV